MKPSDVILRNLWKRLDFKFIGKGLFDGDLVLAAEFHQEYMCDIEDNQDEGLPELHRISVKEDRDNDKVNEDENRFTSDNPPVN